MLARLMYASRALASMDLPTLRGINAASVRSNAATGVTGMLVFGSSTFLQVLEGDRKAINDTYARIASDPRHASPMILQVIEIAERHFQQWAMKIVILDKVRFPNTTSILQNFGTTDDFDPFAYSADTAVRLLRALSPQPGAE